ncbi:hypothetical protein ACR79B_15795 [Sphingobacterium spiritivorum]|uniref:hypothetical protein n=1 Tax=Sphingobacterium spiritivorum TaxID=258 RepID=UPI003DA5D3BB
MARDLQRLAQRNKEMADKYAHLFFIDGKRDELIYQQLADEYHLQPSTIEKIILKESKQISHKQ